MKLLISRSHFNAKNGLIKCQIGLMILRKICLLPPTDGLHNYDECERKVEILIGVSKGLEKRKLQRKIVKISISNTNVSCGQSRR